VATINTDAVVAVAESSAGPAAKRATAGTVSTGPAADRLESVPGAAAPGTSKRGSTKSINPTSRGIGKDRRR
jgi:hypothetical protein